MRKGRLWMAAGVLFVAGVLLIAAEIGRLTGAGSGTGGRWFAADSFWNVPVGPNPALEGSSSAMVRRIAAVSPTAHLVNDQQWGIPVIQATASDPRFSITSRVFPAGAPTVTCFVPAQARPNTGADAHLVVFQPDGTACDFWEFGRGHDGRPTAGTAGRTCGTVTGSSPDSWGTVVCRGRLGNGATAAGFALAGGLILPGELSGKAPIRHALALTLPASVVRRGAPAWPATHTDGVCASSLSCVPEGARLQLDPSLNVAAQPWPNWEKKIALALQTYGGYVADKGGPVGVRALEDGRDSTWTSLGIPVDASLSGLSMSSLRVLRVVPNVGGARGG